MNTQAKLDETPGQYETPARYKAYLSNLPNEIKHILVSFMPEGSLHNLARCNSLWNAVATPALYKLDAKHGNSTAIRWAVTDCAAKDMDIALKILRKSVSFKGNVNAVHEHNGHATALHYAAAYARHKLIEELFRLGAKPGVWCSGVDWFIKLDIPGLNRTMKRQYKWFSEVPRRWGFSALTTAIILKDKATAKLFLRAGASCVVALDEEEYLADVEHPLEEAVTVYHLLAAAEADIIPGWFRLFQRSNSTNVINARMPYWGTALHLAVNLGNGSAFDIILSRGEGIMPDLPNQAIETPMLTAIRKAFEINDNMKPAKRKAIIEWIPKLLHAGALINPAPNAAAAPLAYALREFEFQTSIVPKTAKRVIEILVDIGGADIDWRRGNRDTLLQDFCAQIVARRGSTKMEEILEYLISRGGNLNAAPGLLRGVSIMFDSIMAITGPTGSKSLMSYHKIILESGARLLPNEVPAVFRTWYKGDMLNKSKIYNIMQHKQHIDQPGIDLAWEHAIVKRDEKLLHAMHADGLMPSKGDSLIHGVIECQAQRFWPAIMDIQFNPNCLDANAYGGSLLHTLVRAVHEPPCERSQFIMPNKAVQIAHSLIEKGTSTLIRDNAGKLALELFDEFGIEKQQKLRATLLEAYFQETKDSHRD